MSFYFLVRPICQRECQSLNLAISSIRKVQSVGSSKEVQVRASLIIGVLFFNITFLEPAQQGEISVLPHYYYHAHSPP